MPRPHPPQQPRKPWDLFGMLLSPRALMVAFMGFMALGMPAMLNNMDPETKREFERQQARMGGGNIQEMMQNMLGGEEERGTRRGRARDEEVDEDDSEAVSKSMRSALAKLGRKKE